jgi:hypothetical protein
MSRFYRIAGIALLCAAGPAFGQEAGFDAAQFQKQMEAMQKAMQANAQSTQPVVDFRLLKTFLPETAGGLKRTSAKGEKTGAMGMTVSKAEGAYEGANEARLKVEITDMGGVGMLGALAQAGMAAAEIDNEGDDGYERTTRVKGFKALEKYNTPSKSGSLNVVAGRFTVQIEGSNIAPEVLKAAAEALDLQTISTLKAVAK